MGGYYDTDWKIGSSFGFAKTDGSHLTSGILLGFQPERLIKHSLFEPNNETVMAVITYEFQDKEGYMLLYRKEELTHSMDSDAFEDASEGWESALNSVKQIAEAL